MTHARQAHLNHWGLRLRSEAYQPRPERVSYAAPSAAFRQVRQQPETPGLGEVALLPCPQSLRYREQAFRTCFEGRAKYPAFKKKRGSQAAEYTTSAFKG